MVALNHAQRGTFESLNASFVAIKPRSACLRLENTRLGLLVSVSITRNCSNRAGRELEAAMAFPDKHLDGLLKAAGISKCSRTRLIQIPVASVSCI